MPPGNLKNSKKIFRVLWGVAPRDPKFDSVRMNSVWGETDSRIKV